MNDLLNIASSLTVAGYKVSVQGMDTLFIKSITSNEARAIRAGIVATTDYQVCIVLDPCCSINYSLVFRKG